MMNRVLFTGGQFACFRENSYMLLTRTYTQAYGFFYYKPGTSIRNRVYTVPWWRLQMEIFSTLLGLCAGNSPVTGKFPARRPMTRNFDVFFICARGNGWVNTSEAGDLRHHRTYHDVTAMAAFPLVEFHRLQRQRACKYVNPGCLRSL